MKLISKFRIGVVALGAAILLSACTPPMPPEFKADLAERYVTCVPGDVTVSAPSELSEVVQGWIDGMTESCSDFSGTLVDSATPSDIVIADASIAPSCTVATAAPIGLDAVAVSVTVDGLDGVIFTPALLYKALSGQMTSWADPELQALNPDLELTDTPVVLHTSVRPEDLKALTDWMGRLDPTTWATPPSTLVASNTFDADATLTELETEGSLAVLPASFVTNNSLTTISIQVPDVVDPVYLNVDTVISAGTQLVATTTDSVVKANLDPTLAPVPPPGSDIALDPWQAVNTFQISVCGGANELVGRAFARYTLRLESQGLMITAGYTELPEGIRTAGIDAVSIGLPDPTIPPTDAPVEVVPTDMPTDDPTDMPTEEPAVDATDAATPEPTS
jgi:hypothetical protein